MRYPHRCKSIIDVTKAPYFADNTGKTDSTAAINQALDDCLLGYVTGLIDTGRELWELYEKQGGNVYIGAEAGRVIDGEVYITMPRTIPPARMIFFPAGTYLVSDTLCYSFEDLSARQLPNYTCELCRNIHVLGEDRETTVIRLADNAEGFGTGAKKPVLSFNRKSTKDRETTNCAQQNTLTDITVDCGFGNPGAVGVLYASSNLGRIENVSVCTNRGLSGILFDYGSEGCIENVSVSGFDYGFETCHTSPLVFDGVDVSQNRISGFLTKNGNLVCKGVNSGKLPLFCFEKSGNGRYFCTDQNAEFIGDRQGNHVFYGKGDVSFPKDTPGTDFSKWCCVDDFGAVGDGKTDSAQAIQKALDSGKEVILFGEGTYLVSKTLKIPASVKTVDMAYCDLLPGYSLIVGEMEAFFDVFEPSPTPLFIKNLSPKEDFCGFFRFCKHSCTRPLVLKDISIAAALYFNTAEGGEVYFDNCFTHTNHYTQNCMPRDGYVPVFCRMTPVELSGQKAFAKNLNIERADLELLCDGSELTVYGFKTEGPGKMIKCTHGAKAEIFNFNSAWWGNKDPENEMFEVQNSRLFLSGGNIFCYSDCAGLKNFVKVTEGEVTETRDLDACSSPLPGLDALERPWGRLVSELSFP